MIGYYNPLSGLAQPASQCQELNKPVPAEPKFEVNLTTALVGYKRWKISGDRIFSQHQTCIWIPDRPHMAVCYATTIHQTMAPNVTCTCGIYALDSHKVDGGYGSILGQVYGWGKYVRGDTGWRSQFSYPKCFILEHNQMDLVDILKQYHVPIKIQQYVDIYTPMEDGYEYGNNQEIWNSGAYSGSGATQDR